MAHCRPYSTWSVTNYSSEHLQSFTLPLSHLDCRLPGLRPGLLVVTCPLVPVTQRLLRAWALTDHQPGSQEIPFLVSSKNTCSTSKGLMGVPGFLRRKLALQGVFFLGYGCIIQLCAEKGQQGCIGKGQSKIEGWRTRAPSWGHRQAELGWLLKQAELGCDSSREPAHTLSHHPSLPVTIIYSPLP